MKNTTFTLPSLALIAFLFMWNTLHAQIHVVSNGNVGIDLTNPSAKLDISNVGNAANWNVRSINNYTGSAQKIGLYNICTNTGTGSKYGIYNLTTSPSSTSQLIRGIYSETRTYSDGISTGNYNYLISMGGNAQRFGSYDFVECDANNDGTGHRIALAAIVSGNCATSTAWSALLVGNASLFGSLFQVSDESKKQDIETFDHAIDIIERLKPRTYYFIEDENLSLPTEKQFGFLAQDLESVLPNLVKEAPVFSTPERRGGEGELSDPEFEGYVKSVNYVGMIPVLVQAIQEQQTLIEQQQIEIDALKAKFKQD